MTRRRRGPRPIDPEDAKVAVLTFANVMAGVLDVVGGLANGDRTEVVLKRALRKGRARAKALEDAERAVRGLDGPEDD